MKTPKATAFESVPPSQPSLVPTNHKYLSNKHVTNIFFGLKRDKYFIKTAEHCSFQQTLLMVHSLIQDSAVDVTFQSVFVGRK